MKKLVPFLLLIFIAFSGCSKPSGLDGVMEIQKPFLSNETFNIQISLHNLSDQSIKPTKIDFTFDDLAFEGPKTVEDVAAISPGDSELPAAEAAGVYGFS